MTTPRTMTVDEHCELGSVQAFLSELHALQARKDAHERELADWAHRWLSEGWTQRQLLPAIGHRIGRHRLGRLAIFGRWRAATRVASGEITERSFRDHWSRTDKRDHWHLRCGQVDRMIERKEDPR